MNACILVGNVDADVGGRALRITRQMHEPTHRLRHRVISRSVRVGSVLSKPRDRTHDETRVELLQRFVAETIASQGARTKILDHDIDLWDKSFDDIRSLRL